MVHNFQLKRFFQQVLVYSGILIFSLPTLIGQTKKHYAFEHIVIKDGLSSNFVWAIEQDKYGYLWIATDDGLNLYDGFSIRIYKHDPTDSTSLPDNRINSLLEDSEGILWIGTSNGLARLNRQEMNFETFNIDSTNTPSANVIRAIVEDNKGNLWLGTEEYGAASFDRVTSRFTQHKVMNRDNSLHNFVNGSWTSYVTSDGDLIAGSNSFGLVKFDYDARVFVQMEAKDDFLKDFSRNRVFKFYEDDNNLLWMATSRGLFRLNLRTMEGDEFALFEKDKNAGNGVNANTFLGLHQDQDNNMWIGTRSKGLFIYNPESGDIQQITSNSGSESISSEAIWAFFEDRFGILWFGSLAGVNKYDQEREPFLEYSAKRDNAQGNNIQFYQFDKSVKNNQMIWLTSNDGLYQFDTAGKKFIKYNKINDLMQSSGNAFVNSTLETKDQTLWIASNRGLFRYDLVSGKYKKYNFELYNENGLNSNIIRDLDTDAKGNVWIASNNGINVLDPKTGYLSSIPTWSNRKYSLQIRSLLDSLYHHSKSISSILEVGDYVDQTKEFVVRQESKAIIVSMGEGTPVWNMVDYGWLENNSGDTLWTMFDVSNTFSAEGNPKNRIQIGMFELPKGRYRLRYKSDDSHSTESWNTPLPKDSLWWGIQLYELDEKAYNYFYAILEADISRDFIYSEFVRIIKKDADDRMWLGTNDGLSVYDPSIQKVINFRKDDKNPSSISNNSIRDIAEDKEGNLWIATDGGLNKYNPQTDQFTAFTLKDGLPTDKISSVEFDTLGNVWVSTRAGISRLNTKATGGSPLFVNYDVSDGLQGYTFFYNSSFRDGDGQIYFSGQNGINAFTPGKINNNPPEIAITDILVSNKSIKVYDDEQLRKIDLLEDKRIELPFNYNDLSFEFASIHYARPGRNKMMYQMQGIDTEWQNGHRRFATYTNLDPGSYRFMVKGSNGDGVWSEKIKTIDIVITPPWWSTLWAYLIYFVLFASLLYSVRRFDLKRKMKDSKLKESQLKAEAAELQAKAAEAQNRAIQIENDRKSKELDEARELQLSMLPQELPNLPQLDIAVYMKTATEVGGDYYDFNVGMDGTLTVVIGDATGHGMKAGTMVTTAKSLFNTHAANPDIIFTFNEITRCIKKMHMQMLSMCLTMLKVEGKQMTLSAAGMPPVLHYKRDVQTTDEITLKGMPLGTMEQFPYELVTRNIETGDTLLLMTDGMPELRNESDEMFGYKRIRDTFESVAEKDPEEIIEHLKGKGSEWVNHKDPDDDVTFVVLKVK